MVTVISFLDKLNKAHRHIMIGLSGVTVAVMCPNCHIWSKSLLKFINPFEKSEDPELLNSKYFHVVIIAMSWYGQLYCLHLICRSHITKQ